MKPLIYIEHIELNLASAPAHAGALAALLEMQTRRAAPRPPSPAGHAQRFIVTGEIVRDTLTGLSWTREDASPDDVNWEAAGAACKACRVGGFDDWRRPSRIELLSLVDDTRHSPAIDTTAFPNCKSGWYWTGTEYAPSPRDSAWVVYFSSGFAFDSSHADHARVRAVRGPSRQ